VFHFLRGAGTPPDEGATGHRGIAESLTTWDGPDASDLVALPTSLRLDHLHDHQHDQDDQEQAEASAGTVAPVAAVRPGGNCAKEQEHEDDDEDGA
jgi:hypothetical protein